MRQRRAEPGEARGRELVDSLRVPVLSGGRGASRRVSECLTSLVGEVEPRSRRHLDWRRRRLPPAWRGCLQLGEGVGYVGAGIPACFNARFKTNHATINAANPATRSHSTRTPPQSSSRPAAPEAPDPQLSLPSMVVLPTTTQPPNSELPLSEVQRLFD